MLREGDLIEGVRQRDAITTTLDAMDALATGFKGIPGRKNLVWVTGGFPFQVTDPNAVGGMSSEFDTRYQQTWQKLSDANIAVYPVDLRGLFDSRWNPATVDPGALHQRWDLEPPMVNQQTSTHLTLQLFAQQTSGIVCENNNDLPKCLNAVAQDSESNYTLSFYVGSDLRVSGWHKLKVAVINQSRLKVRSREGFFLGKADALPYNDDPAKGVLSVLRSPIPSTNLPFSVQWLRQAETSAVNPKARLSKTTTRKQLSAPYFALRFHRTHWL